MIALTTGRHTRAFMVHFKQLGFKLIGMYTLVTLGKVLEGRFHEEKAKLRFDNAEGAIRIENPLQRQIQIDRDMAVPLGHIEFGLIDKGRN